MSTIFFEKKIPYGFIQKISNKAQLILVFEATSTALLNCLFLDFSTLCSSTVQPRKGDNLTNTTIMLPLADDVCVTI